MAGQAIDAAHHAPHAVVEVLHVASGGAMLSQGVFSDVFGRKFGLWRQKKVGWSKDKISRWKKSDMETWGELIGTSTAYVTLTEF